jgi:hypothetical protein
MGFGKIVLSNKFEDNDFQAVNIREIGEIDMGVTKRQKALTQHPVDSYYFVKTDGRTFLKIVDYQKFWSISKYLVVGRRLLKKVISNNEQGMTNVEGGKLRHSSFLVRYSIFIISPHLMRRRPRSRRLVHPGQVGVIRTRALLQFGKRRGQHVFQLIVVVELVPVVVKLGISSRSASSMAWLMSA